MTDLPAPSPAHRPLERMLDDIEQVALNRETVLVGEVIDAFARRGIGPVLTLASAITVLPTGMVPLIPAAMGVIMLLAASQLLRGRHELHLPARLYRLQLPATRVLAAVARAQPSVTRLSQIVRPHWRWLARGWLPTRLVALCIIATSLIIIAIGALPGLPFVLALPLLAFGLGLTTQDGRFIAAGLAVTLPTAYGALRWADLF